MSIFVVVWHMGGVGQSLIFSQEGYLGHIFGISDFLNFHILLLAVPTFIFISIYLYASNPVSLLVLKKRLARLIILLSFWPIALIIYSQGFHGLAAIYPFSLSEFIYIILSAGQTIYYFFSSLIICVFVVYFFLKLNQTLQRSIFLSSAILLAFLPQITKVTGFYALSAYWSPLNFIPLSFAAVLFARNRNKIIENRNMFIPLSMLLCVFFSILEWKFSVGQIFFAGQGYAIPGYTRISLLFAVFAIFLIALNPKIKPNRVIKYMSRYSLALYCVHPFLTSPVKKIVLVFVRNQIIGLYISIILVVIFSYCIAMLLKKYYIREEVIV